jgi:hypothetical protein
MSDLCTRCGHIREEHSEFIDNQIASNTYKPERRHCLHENEEGDVDCYCHCFTTEPECACNGCSEISTAVYKGSHYCKRCESINCDVTSGQGCQKYSEPHKVLPPSTDEEVEASDNVVIKEAGLEPKEITKEYSTPFHHDKLCFTCVNSKLPGVLFAVDGDRIQRCDECKIFTDDVAAATFVSATMGLPIKSLEVVDEPERYVLWTGDDDLIYSVAQSLKKQC